MSHFFVAVPDGLLVCGRRHLRNVSARRRRRQMLKLHPHLEMRSHKHLCPKSLRQSVVAVTVGSVRINRFQLAKGLIGGRPPDVRFGCYW